MNYSTDSLAHLNASLDTLVRDLASGTEEQRHAAFEPVQQFVEEKYEGNPECYNLLLQKG